MYLSQLGMGICGLYLFINYFFQKDNQGILQC